MTRRQARLVGLASIPLVVTSYVQSGELTWLAFWPVFGAGLVAGSAAVGRGESGSGAGFDAGEVGAVPGLWTLLDVFVFSGGLRADPLGVGALVALLAPLIILLGGLSGAVGGWVGGSLAGYLGRRRRPATADT